MNFMNSLKSFKKSPVVFIVSLGLIFSLAACSLISPYKTPIQQGRIITDKQISSLSPGMTQDQVQFILGTPGTQDPFNSNTWYYVYTDKKGNYPMTEKQLIVVFKDHKLIQINGDYSIPASATTSS
jgi:outer membrane protein assembly factor BamE